MTPEPVPVSEGPVTAIVGPTAAGKSDLAVRTALRDGGEVVSVDSMQIYRGMDIGTAKLSSAERQGVPHHLLDVVEVTTAVTVAEFQAWARAAVADCHARGVRPILVGGSALYMRAVLDDFRFPGTDPAVRARLQVELDAHGPEALHRRLSDHDPKAAASILPNHGRRIVRALEVIEITGRPFSANLPDHRSVYPEVDWIGVGVSREELNRRIATRVERMWEQGLVEEVRSLAERGLREGPTASKALGYAQVLDFLAGERSEEAAREATIVGTRKFARRQDQWFRKDPRIAWC